MKENGFFSEVYKVVRSIPKGRVATYGDIAKLTGYPRRARLVGYALHANPDGEKTPCYKVVNRFGELADAFVFGGKGEQQKLLEKDGIQVTSGKVDLEKYRIKI